MDHTAPRPISHLREFATLSPRERTSALRSASALRAADEATALGALAELATLNAEERDAAQPLVTAILESLAQRARTLSRNTKLSPLPPESLDRIHSLYNDLRDLAPAAWALLGWLAAVRGDSELRLLAEQLVTAPPADAPQLAVALSPLFQRADYDPAALFPRLLDALAHQHLAGVVLDLANHASRTGRASVHPAYERRGELSALLGSIVARLGQLEEEPDADGRTAKDVAEIVQQSLPLAVSLCDALALIGDEAAIGKLHQAMELRHRRLRTEAAAALARLGDKKGEDILIELAAEPVARLRVLAYAQELSLTERIKSEYRTDAAQAEAQLALWLSQPAQFGLPPTSLELIDEREQHWPSFDDAVECYLFRYQYDLGGATFANIGIAGPLEHTFQADLADLPPDDIYAAFAGWQAQHEDIREQDVSTFGDKQQVEVARLQRRLTDHGFEGIAPTTLASFFGERVLVASARYERHPGIAVVTHGGEISWFPRAATSRPLGPLEAYCIFKGRRLLRTFNP